MAYKKIVVIVITVVYLLSCSGLSDFRAHNTFVSDVLLKDKTVNSHYLVHQGFSLHYVATGIPEQAVVLWLHGTPGLWTEAGKLMTNDAFLKKVKLVSIDRPGWGESKSLEKTSPSATFSAFSVSSYLTTSTAVN